MTPAQLDAWRVVPRLLVTLYAAVCWVVADWFMGLGDPTAAQAAFVSTVWGGAAAWFGLYVNSGGNRGHSQQVPRE